MKIKRMFAFLLAAFLIMTGLPIYAENFRNIDEHSFSYDELIGSNSIGSLDTCGEFVMVNRIKGVNTRSTTAYYIIRQYNGKMLSSPSSGEFSLSWYSDGVSNNHAIQKWLFTGDGNGNYIVFSNVDSNKCLTVNPNTKKVTLSNYISSQYQKWKMAYSSNNGNALVCVSSDTAVNGYKLVINVDDMRVSNSTYTQVGFFQVSLYTPPSSVCHDTVYIGLHQTKTVIPVTTPSSATCSNPWYVWSISNTNVSVSHGEVTGNNLGSATLTFEDKITRVSGSCTVTVIEIPNGVYYLKNKKSGKYADIYNQTMSNGTVVEQKTFSGNASQRWTFSYQSSGYYLIKSENSVSVFRLAVKDDGTDENQPIVIASGSITNGMKWKAIKTTSEAYMLRPKVGEANNRVAAVGSTFNGADLKQKSYVDDMNYRDEWYILDAYTEYAIVMTGSENGEFDYDGVEFYFNTYARKRGDQYTPMTKQEYIGLLTGKNYICSIGHGNETQIQIHDNVVLSLSELSAISSSSFFSTKLIILNSCCSGWPGANNFVDTLCGKGVDAVVGFSGDIDVNVSTYWTDCFLRALTLGLSIESAKIVANNAVLQRYSGINDLILNQVINGAYFGSTDLDSVIFP